MEYENGLPNGKAQLFKDGALQQSWFVEDGVGVGPINVFRDGVFIGLLTWECLKGTADREDNNYREVVFRYGRPTLEIRQFDTKMLLYSGEYNQENLRREGYGIAYNEENGVEDCYGYFEHDRLVHTIQDFVLDEQGCLIMKEYEGDFSLKNERNVSNRHLVYTGGYTFDEVQGRFVRHGYGVELDTRTGQARWKAEWINGKINPHSSEEFYAGMHIHHLGFALTSPERDDLVSLKDVTRTKTEEERRREEEERQRNTRVLLCAGLRYYETLGIENLIIASNEYNDRGGANTVLELRISRLLELKEIIIGDRCFAHVCKVDLDELPNLHTMIIGEGCFHSGIVNMYPAENASGVLTIKNCHAFKQLVIGDNSFHEYNKIEVQQMNALRSITFGKNCFKMSNLTLTSMESYYSFG